MTTIRYRWILAPNPHMAITPICIHWCHVENRRRNIHIFYYAFDHIWNWVSVLAICSFPRLFSHFASFAVMSTSTKKKNILELFSASSIALVISKGINIVTITTNSPPMCWFESSEEYSCSVCVNIILHPRCPGM